MKRALGRLLLGTVLLALAACRAEPTDPSGRLAAPQYVTASTGPGLNNITVLWLSVPGATSYNVYWGTTSGVTTHNGTKFPTMLGST